MTFWTQDPQDKLDYQVTVSGDTVASSTASITPSTGVTLGATVNGTTTAKVRVSGLTLNTTYTLTIHVVGASGQEWDRSTEIRCLAA